MLTGDTIVAAASGPGRSGRAIIRLSGPAAISAVSIHLSAPPPAPAAASAAVFILSTSTAAHLELPILLLTAKSPRSFTGEDSSEILLPGNPALVERVIEALKRSPGVRHAGPGEFSARAYLNGRLLLAQAEAVAGLIAAAGDDDLAAARAAMTGQQGPRFAAWADELATLLALIEAGIDFSDQESVVPITPAALASRLTTLVESLSAALGTGASGPDWRPRALLIGRPNAGKSTLFNALLGRPRTITSPIAGTTRDVIAEPLCAPGTLSALGLEVVLMDSPGVEPGAADTLARAVSEASTLIWCDPTARFNPAALPECAKTKPLIRVRTMADRPAPLAPPGTTAPDTPRPHTLSVCAIDGYHLAELRAAIMEACWGRASSGAPGTSRGLLPRHRRIVAQARAQLAPAAAAARQRSRSSLQSPELLAADLRTALNTLGELTGRMDPDAVIGRVFSTFCIGK